MAYRASSSGARGAERRPPTIPGVHPHRQAATRLASALAALLLSLLLQACAAPGSAPARAADLAALQGVVESFRAAIVRKDKPAFMALFFSSDPQHVTWQSVVDDPSLHWLQKTRPQAIKAPPAGVQRRQLHRRSRRQPGA